MCNKSASTFCSCFDETMKYQTWPRLKLTGARLVEADTESVLVCFQFKDINLVSSQSHWDTLLETAAQCFAGVQLVSCSLHTDDDSELNLVVCLLFCRYLANFKSRVHLTMCHTSSLPHYFAGAPSLHPGFSDVTSLKTQRFLFLPAAEERVISLQ